MTELKPCPFCGSEAKLDENVEPYRGPHCPNNNCIMAAIYGGARGLDKNIETWNTRAPTTNPPETSSELVDDELARQALGFAYAFCATWESQGKRVGELEFPVLAESWERATGNPDLARVKA